MEKPTQVPEQQIANADSAQDQNRDSSRRSETHIQRDDVGTTGDTRERQPQQSTVPDAELNGD